MMPPSMATVEAQAACRRRSRLELEGYLFRLALLWLCVSKADDTSRAFWYFASASEK